MGLGIKLGVGMGVRLVMEQTDNLQAEHLAKNRVRLGLSWAKGAVGLGLGQGRSRSWARDDADGLWRSGQKNIF